MQSPKGSNIVGHHTGNKNGGRGSSGGSNTPSRSQRKVSVVIGQPFTIRHEPTSEDKEQYAEERTSRLAMLSVAAKLNWITVGGVFVTVLSVGAVYLTLRQTSRNTRIDQRAWLGIKHVDPATIHGAFGAMAEFQNTGKTPALNVKFHQSIDELLPPIPGVADPNGIF